MHIWRRLAQLLIILSCLIITGSIIALVLIVESVPMLHTNLKIDSQSAKQVMDFSREIKHQIGNNDEEIELIANQNQLNGLIAMAQKANLKLTGGINISSQGLYLELSKELPSNILGNYVNLSLFIVPSTSKLDLAYVKLGRLELPGPFLLMVIEKSFAVMTSDGWLSNNLFDEVNSVKFTDNQIMIGYHLTQQTKTAAKQLLGRLSSYQSEHNLIHNNDRIRQYYQILIDTTDKTPKRPVSLANYIQPLFKFAAQRSIENSPISENRAALTALILYFTNTHFEYLIGDVLTPRMKTHRPKQNATLANRRDLQRHFVYSAAIELFSTTEISHFIGELKELLDSNKGGSGFSFIDLLADRAGVRFVLNATGNDVTARQLQTLISEDFDEGRMFPPINELQEGLSVSEFESQYKTINAKPYQELLENIEQRLMTLPIYQLKKTQPK